MRNKIHQKYNLCNTLCCIDPAKCDLEQTRFELAMLDFRHLLAQQARYPNDRVSLLGTLAARRLDPACAGEKKLPGRSQRVWGHILALPREHPHGESIPPGAISNGWDLSSQCSIFGPCWPASRLIGFPFWEHVPRGTRILPALAEKNHRAAASAFGSISSLSLANILTMSPSRWVRSQTDGI